MKSDLRNLLKSEKQVLDFLLSRYFPGRDELVEQIQAVANDEDGVPTQVFLHVVEGKLDELEFVKADNSAVKKPVEAKNLKTVEVKREH